MLRLFTVWVSSTDWLPGQKRRRAIAPPSHPVNKFWSHSISNTVARRLEGLRPRIQLSFKKDARGKLNVVRIRINYIVCCMIKLVIVMIIILIMTLQLKPNFLENDTTIEPLWFYNSIHYKSSMFNAYTCIICIGCL